MSTHSKTDLGWSALPRLAFWFCVPAIVAGVAGAASQVGRLAAPSESPTAGALASSAGVVAILFGTPALVLTPVGAVLILVLSILRKWPARVVAVLWIAVIGAMAMMLPALDAAVSNWMVLQGVGREGRR